MPLQCGETPPLVLARHTPAWRQQSPNRSVIPCSVVTWCSLRSKWRTRQIQKKWLHMLPLPSVGHVCIFFVLLPRFRKISVVWLMVFSSGCATFRLLGHRSAPFLNRAGCWWCACYAYYLRQPPCVRVFRPNPPHTHAHGWRIALNRREGSHSRYRFPTLMPKPNR